MARFFKLLDWIWPLMAFLIGVGSFGTGVGYAIETASLVLSSRRASGVVIQVESRSDDDNDWYAAHVAYAVGGQEYELIGNSSFRVFSVGDQVGVLYRVPSPSAGRIDTTGQLWGDAGSFVFGGLSSIAFGVGWFLWRRRRAARAAARHGPGLAPS